jgi:hypothetical protein
MFQVKVFDLRSPLAPIIPIVSDVVHSCVVDALQYPQDKRARRFFPLEPTEFFCPAGRSDKYTTVGPACLKGPTSPFDRSRSWLG